MERLPPGSHELPEPPWKHRLPRPRGTTASGVRATRQQSQMWPNGGRERGRGQDQTPAVLGPTATKPGHSVWSQLAPSHAGLRACSLSTGHPPLGAPMLVPPAPAAHTHASGPHPYYPLPNCGTLLEPLPRRPPPLPAPGPCTAPSLLQAPGCPSLPAPAVWWHAEARSFHHYKPDLLPQPLTDSPPAT